MSRIRAVYCASLLVGVAASCSYGSIKATGDVATVLPTQIPVLQQVGDLCRLGAATSGDESRDSCDAFGNVQPVYANAAKQLASYGVALKELAGTGKIEAGDLVSALIEVGDLGDLGGIPIDGGKEVLTQAIAVLVDVFANGYKKRNVKHAVTRTDRAVQCIVARELVNLAAVRSQLSGLQNDLAHEREDIEILREKMATNKPSPPEPEPGQTDLTPGAQAVYKAEKTAWRARRDATQSRSVVMSGATLTAASAIRRVEAFERGLKSFAVAHNRLACFSTQIGTLKDGRLRDQVLDDIRCAATNNAEPTPACTRVARVLEANHTCTEVSAPQPRCVW